jgi:hypothetical protein
MIQVRLVGELKPADRFGVLELEVGRENLHLSHSEVVAEAFQNVGKRLIVREGQTEKDLHSEVIDKQLATFADVLAESGRSVGKRFGVDGFQVVVDNSTSSVGAELGGVGLQKKKERLQFGVYEVVLGCGLRAVRGAYIGADDVQEECRGSTLKNTVRLSVYHRAWLVVTSFLKREVGATVQGRRQARGGPSPRSGCPHVCG